MKHVFVKFSEKEKEEIKQTMMNIKNEGKWFKKK